MSVNGVNNSCNNASLYAASGAALVGASAGASAAYLTKPYLKNGAPTDSFLKEITNNGTKQVKKLLAATVDKIKTADELQNFIKDFDEIINMNADKEVAEDLATGSFESAKSNLKKYLLKLKNLINLETANEMFEASWDATSKKFVHNTEKVLEEEFSVVKNAARKIQGKYAMMFGAIGAGVLGLTTLLLSANGKKDSPEAVMGNNTQA